MIKKLIEKYWYIILIIIILLSIIPIRTESPTSKVILNLKQQDSNYIIENPSQQKINLTVYQKNLITSSVILDPNRNHSIFEKEFLALGEQYE